MATLTCVYRNRTFLMITWANLLVGILAVEGVTILTCVCRNRTFLRVTWASLLSPLGEISKMVFQIIFEISRLRDILLTVCVHKRVHYYY